ncbi:PH domain-containing protein [Staphylococcus haemolyticus]|uniref:PH domain-containing protein n=1 Tax=Staphylococcus haemolyticus TaxID=1283 RepID=UPI00069FB065|nr:PH domain-containing protein [Staphylococcus haemolyticus]
MSNYNYMNKNGLKVMRIASMITSIIFTIIVIIASILCDLYIEEMSRALLVSLAIVLIILCCVVFIVITPFLKYKNFRYSHSNDEIYIRRGIIFINTKIIPFYRIQNIDIKEGFLMRKYELASLHLSTAGGVSQIELIAKTDAINLKQMIQNKKKIQQNDISEMNKKIDHSNLPSE